MQRDDVERSTERVQRDNEVETEARQQRRRSGAVTRRYYIKGCIVGSGSEAMLIQSEVATRLTGSPPREREKAKGVEGKGERRASEIRRARELGEPKRKQEAARKGRRGSRGGERERGSIGRKA